MKTTSAREDVRDRMRWFGLAGVLGNTARMLRMWASSPENRKMLRHFLGMQASVPKDLYEYYGYGLNKDDSELLTDFNQEITKMHENGEWDKIFQKWFK